MEMQGGTEESHQQNCETKPARKTWSELRGIVSELRRKMSSMSAGCVPGSITFRSLPDGRWVIIRKDLLKLLIMCNALCSVRIYFLSTPSNGWETTLLYADIGHSDHANGYRLPWQPVIEANFQRCEDF